MAQPAELIFCPNERCSFRLKHGRPAEYRAGFETCSNCGTALAAGSAAQATLLRVVEDAPPLGAVPWRAIAVTAVAPLVVSAAEWILLPGLDHSAVRGQLPRAIAIAIVLDLVTEVRARRQVQDLVSIWPMHRTYAVAPLAQALEKAGIFTFIRGERFRTLAPFLDSYVPMEVFVPAAEQERAREIVASILAPEKTAA